MNYKILLPLILLAVGLLSSCGEGPVENQLDEALEQYANIVFANYEDSYATAEFLRNEINDFVANPTEQGLQDCKDAWLSARVPYGQTEAFRFYNGPIDGADGPEGLINAWPMDENFIDYVAGNPDAGLINDPVSYPDITANLLENLNESFAETSIFTGYHAIEFLLWGQDLSSTSAGTRPYTDYVTDGSGTASNQDRRGAYLKVVAELLLSNLATVRDAWASNGSYRDEFLNQTDQHVALGYLFTSMGELAKGELAGERMFVAVDSGDQEDEHSCFSDNTHVDILMNFKGIENVYFGRYTRTNGVKLEGKSLAEVAHDLNEEKANAAEAAFAHAESAINNIMTPFDNAILNDKDDVLTAVQALRDLSDRIVDVGLEMDAQF
ncbi:MAG: imelysin family protein [Bacteroidia bacterium]